MENSYPQLLNEKLRPKALRDLNLPEGVIARFETMRRSGFPMNLIFYGKPGIGKTSAARLLLQNVDFMELNGSHNKGDKSFVNQIENFSSTVSFLGQSKVVFIDEADFMPKSVQDGLRYVIENCSGYTRFIMTANDYSKLTPAIRSRCVGINFDVAPKDRLQVVERMGTRYQKQLQELGVKFEPSRLNEIVAIYFPDLRAIANQIELEFGGV